MNILKLIKNKSIFGKKLEFIFDKLSQDKFTNEEILFKNKFKKVLSFSLISFLTLSTFNWSSHATGSIDYDLQYDCYNTSGLNLSYNCLYGSDDNYSEYDYYIKNADISVVINDKREYEITETLDVYYNMTKHGIVRSIPISENYKITDISVNGDNYSIYQENGNKVIKIGKSDAYVLGDKSYVVKYTLKHNKDEDKTIDYADINLWGNDWDVPVVNFTSTVIYPNNFTLKNVELYSGKYTSSTNEYSVFELNDNTITVKNTKVIPEFNAITINIDFAEGDFANVPIGGPIIASYALLIISLLSLMLSVALYVNRRDKIRSIVRTVEFYPPENVDAVDMGYLYRDMFSDDLLPVYIYKWASSGFLEIQLLGNKDLRLTKLKDIENCAIYEKDMFNQLFSSSSLDESKRRFIEGDKIGNKLYEAYETAKANVEDKFESDERFNKKKFRLGFIIAPIIIITIFAFSIFYSSAFILSDIILVVIIFSIIKDFRRFMDYRKSILANIFSKKVFKHYIKSLAIIVIVVGVSMFYRCLAMMYVLEINKLNVVSTIMASISIFIMMITARNKTSYEKELLGKILGFREFIEKAEKNRLEMLLEDNPSYFYDILPFAQALDITDIWSDKFKNISMVNSVGYNGLSTYQYVTITNSLNKIMMSAHADRMASSVRHGGGFRGGAGGGSGGGGGRSW